MPETATCSSVLDLLEAHVDGELDRDTNGVVEAHLATCVACRLELGRARRIALALRDLPELDPPPFLRAAVAHRTEGPNRSDRAAGRWRQFVLPLAAGLAAVALGVTLWRGSGSGVSIQSPPPQARSESAEPTAEEIAEATLQVRLALTRVGESQRRASLAALEVVAREVERAATRGLRRPPGQRATERVPRPAPSTTAEPTLPGAPERSRA